MAQENFSSDKKVIIKQGCADTGRKATRALEFCNVVPNICGFSVSYLLCVIFIARIILRGLPDFWDICVPR